MKMIQAEKTLKNPVQNLIKSQKSVDFKIGDAAKIIDILRSKIYSNPIKTLVQEYLSNARDAIREVNGGAIHVTLPNEENPTFTVRDFGPGIDNDRMLNCFVQYGNTTKAESNTQTGGFGLGSKLAWAYTDTFTIVTYVNGIETQYVAHIGKNKNGTLDLISTQKTSEPNGTEIRIPVQEQDFDAFRRAVDVATFFWRESEKPMVNGEKPELVAPIQLSPAMQVYTAQDVGDLFENNQYRGNLIIAIDGIGYPLSRSFTRANEELEILSSEIASKATLVFHVGNGVIEVAASRETITENDRTLKVVSGQAIEAKKLLAAWQKKMLKADNILDFISKVRLVIKYVSESTFEFKDDTKETFKVTANNGYYQANDKLNLSSDLMDKLEISYFESGAVKRRGRRSPYRSQAIDVDAVLIVADEKPSKARQTMKVKRQAGYSSAVLISKGQQTDKYLLSLGERLGAVKLSAIVLPKVERQAPERVADGQIKMHVLTEQGWRDRKSTTEKTVFLEVNETKYVYFNRDDKSVEISKYDSLRKFLNYAGFQVAVMGKNTIKTVQSDKNFVALDVFLNDPTKVVTKAKFTSLEKAAANYLTSHSPGKLVELCNDVSANKIKDKQLKTDLKRVGEFLKHDDSFDLRHDDFLLTHLIVNNPLVAEMKKLSQSLPQYIASNYPLVAYIEQHYERGDRYNHETGQYEKVKEKATKAQWITEVVNYLNGKFTA